MIGFMGGGERGSLGEFVLALRKVMLELAKNPLAEKNTKDSGDVADEVQKLKPREALVKISNRVYEMRTLDLTSTGANLEVLKQIVVGRTRAKYCTPISDVMEDIKKRRSGMVADDKRQGSQAKTENTKTNGIAGVNRFDDLDDDI